MLALVLLGVAVLLVYVIASHAASRYRTTERPRLVDVDKRFTALENRKDGAAPTLSIVVPCYNEEERLPPMLKDTVAFCAAHVKAPGATFSDYEIIIVDDCSTDKTRDVAEAFIRANPDVKIRLHRVVPNHGKGFAVRSGFFQAFGDYVLMADGDNATRISDVAKLFESLHFKLTDRRFDVAVGSRAHLEHQSIAQRTLGRTILMKLFHFVVAVTYLTCTTRPCHLHDTQCGFKLFNRSRCERVFRSNRLERWAFDVELLIHCRRLGINVIEVPVNWQEIPGSKVRIGGMIQMGLECLLMCLAYPLGLWTTAK